MGSPREVSMSQQGHWVIIDEYKPQSHKYFFPFSQVSKNSKGWKVVFSLEFQSQECVQLSNPSCGHVNGVNLQAMTEHTRSTEGMICVPQWYAEWYLFNFMTSIDNQIGSLKEITSFVLVWLVSCLSFWWVAVFLMQYIWESVTQKSRMTQVLRRKGPFRKGMKMGGGMVAVGSAKWNSSLLCYKCPMPLCSHLVSPNRDPDGCRDDIFTTRLWPD